MYGPGDGAKPRGVRKVPHHGDNFNICPNRVAEPQGFELGTILTARPHGVRKIEAPGQIDYSPVSGRGGAPSVDHSSVHHGIRMVYQARPGYALAPIPGFHGVGAADAYDRDQVLSHKKEVGARHFMDHDPLNARPHPIDEEEIRRRNAEKHPEFWKAVPTRALIVGDASLAQRAMPPEQDFIPRGCRGEFSPSNYQKETVIAGLGEMGRGIGVHQVRKKSIAGPEPMFAPAPHRSTLLQQARVWSYCV